MIWRGKRILRIFLGRFDFKKVSGNIWRKGSLEVSVEEEILEKNRLYRKNQRENSGKLDLT